MRTLVILCFALIAVTAYGDDAERETSQSKTTPPDVSAAPLAYTPPKSIGAPRGRMIGAASRAARTPALTLYSLVPEHVGQTVSEQPSLFWYIDALPAEDALVYFTLTNELEIDPIAEIRLSDLSKIGIQRVDLAEHGIKLERGIEYEWTVAIIVNPKQRANDIITAGSIIVVDEPGGLEPSARSYAAHGLWYDAIATAPDDFRADLLREVGLGNIAQGPKPD